MNQVQQANYWVEFRTIFDLVRFIANLISNIKREKDNLNNFIFCLISFDYDHLSVHIYNYKVCGNIKRKKIQIIGCQCNNKMIAHGILQQNFIGTLLIHMHKSPLLWSGIKNKVLGTLESNDPHTSCCLHNQSRLYI